MSTTIAESKEQELEKSLPKKKSMFKKKSVATTLCFSLLTVGSLQGYGLFFGAGDVVIHTETISYGQLGTVLQGSGTATSAEIQAITAVAGSEVLGVYVTAGEMVEAGQLLYIQDDSALDDTISDYEEEIDNHYDSISAYQSTISDFQKSISQLEKEIESASIKAPFSGNVSLVSVKNSDSVSAGQQLMELTNLKDMKVTLYFSYAYENEIAVGDLAKISIPDQMLVLDGTVSALKKVEYITKEGTSAFSVTISMTNPNSVTSGTMVSASIGDMYPVEGGMLEYAEELSINAPMSGEINKIYVDNYENVVQGQVLCSLNVEDYQEEIQSLQENIASTQKQIATIQDKILDLQEDIAKVNESRSEYEVYSEISGKVISVNLEEGKVPNTSATAVLIYNLEQMEMTAQIDELDFEQVYQGMPVEITYSTASNTQEFEGVVTAISQEATNESGVAYFPVTITVNSEGLLSAGVNLSYTILPDGTEEGYLVPIDGIKQYDDGVCVYVQGDSAEGLPIEDVPEGFYAIPVEISASNSQSALVLDGLAEDMVIFTRYQATEPANGSTTSNQNSNEMDMAAMREQRENMMGSGAMGGMAGGGVAAGTGGVGNKRGS